MKKIAFLLLAILINIACLAVRPQRGPHTVSQPDGTKLTILSYGDADTHWYTTTDGALLVHQGTSYYVAKVTDDGQLLSTGILAHNPSMRNDEENEQVSKQDKDLFYSRITNDAENRRKVQRREKLSINSSYFPHNGSPKAIVILAEFQDTVFRNDYNSTKVLFDSLLNANGKPANDVDNSISLNYGSVRQYFKDMSFGAFTPQFDVYGPVKLNKNLKYYGKGKDDNMSDFIPEVCSAADDMIDFTQYDANNDGFIELVYIIYAGFGENYNGVSSDAIWPKSGETSSSQTFDGMKLKRYGVHCELGGFPGAWGWEKEKKRINGIGLFVHEFSHCMGLPDIYPTVDAARINNQAMEDWDVMDGGEYLGYNIGCYPAEYTPWEREIMGWMKVDTLKEAGQVSLQTIQNGGKAYKIFNDNDTKQREYFLVFNVQKQGWNEKARGSGMLVLHIDSKSEYIGLGDSPNNVVGHPRHTIVPADGLLISSYKVLSENEVDPSKYTRQEYLASYAGDPFPGSQNNHFLTDTSAVKPTGYVGEHLAKPIFNIQENQGIVTFDFLEDSSLGVKAVLINPDEEKRRIYSLHGVYLGNDISRLPKGIYIVNKKKIAIP